ncbi:MAG: rod shape-determining protein MreC [Verrucomicrobiales bacterium]
MSRLNIILLIVFVGLLIWITLFSPSRIARIQNGAMVAFEPFIEASGAVEDGLEQAGNEPLSPSELRTKLANLQRERDELKLKVIQADKLVRENNELRKALRYTLRSERSLIPARVVTRKPSTWYNTIIINRGSFHGVAVDSPVIVPVGDEAGLVGKVSEVISEESALILLLTDEICQVSARLEGSQIQGILSGARGAFRTLPNLRLRYLPKESDAGTGRKVITSGDGGLFPPDLLLGEIIKFDIGPIDAEATLVPSVNFDALTDVFVVKPVAGSVEDPEELSLAEGAEGAEVPELEEEGTPNPPAEEREP